MRDRETFTFKNDVHRLWQRQSTKDIQRIKISFFFLFLFYENYNGKVTNEKSQFAGNSRHSKCRWNNTNKIKTIQIIKIKKIEDNVVNSRHLLHSVTDDFKEFSFKYVLNFLMIIWSEFHIVMPKKCRMMEASSTASVMDRWYWHSSIAEKGRAKVKKNKERRGRRHWPTYMTAHWKRNLH